MSNIQGGIDLLDKLNHRISPRTNEAALTNVDTARVEGRAIELDSTSNAVANSDNAAVGEASEQSNKPGLHHTWKPIHPARSMPIPSANAAHNKAFIQVGGLVVGNVPDSASLPTAKRHCRRCMRFGGEDALTLASSCAGRGGSQHCRNFDSSGNKTKRKAQRKCANCVAHDNHKKSLVCKGRDGVNLCNFSPIDELTPQPKQRELY